jgi:hypothetical protein
VILDRAKLESALKKKGFGLMSGDHRYYRLYVAGKATRIQTKVSHGSSKTLSHGLVSTIKRQMRFDTNDQLSSFVDCRMTEEDYVGFLRENGRL